MRLLLISNSTMPGEAYLDYPKYEIKQFLGDKSLTALFIPYAAVTFSFDLYEQKVAERFAELGFQLKSIHHFSDPVQAVKDAEVIVVGGGNTWQLVRMMHDNQLMEVIREKVVNGTPYIGWSAGANVACPTLRTTNDMPIIDPKGFDTIGLIPFQINPHYMDANPQGHGGETREQRIEEFIEINSTLFVVGLREGSMLRIEDEKMRLIGKRTARIFLKGNTPLELSPDNDLSFLLE